MSNDMNNAITAAIGAHGMWKLRLGTAVNTGRMWTRSQDACRDDQCEFGHWLHGKTIDPQVKRGLPYQVVKRLHAEFHSCAGEVLRCVEAGDKARARSIMEGEYAARTDKLLRALTKWKREVGGARAA